MKTAFFLVLLSFQAHATSLNLRSALKYRDRIALTSEFRNFVVNDFATSIYCEEGWGEQVVEMQTACHVERIRLLRESKNQKWMQAFRLTMANSENGVTKYSFVRTLALTPEAPLMCDVSINLEIEEKSEKVLNKVIDLYCDH